MKVFIKLTILTLIVIALFSIYFEYIINRPVNSYIQLGTSIIAIIIAVAYLVYLVKEILNILKP